jgi:ferritin-like metal-binding protein YciE
MPDTNALRELFVDELRDIYDAEKQLIKALPRMAKAATSGDLRMALESHLAETEGQAQRLEEVFGLVDQPRRGKHCTGMAGIVEEGKAKMEEGLDGAAMDAALIAAAQRVEHYEIAAYGTLAAWAQQLGLPDAVTLLRETLDEESAADEKLSMLAERGINEAASTAGEEEEESESGRRGGASSRKRSGGNRGGSRGRGSRGGARAAQSGKGGARKRGGTRSKTAKRGRAAGGGRSRKR